MLKELTIKNIALIENLTINFFDGLNVLTGETGAGKSIIIDSLNFVLGARSDKTLIRSGESVARVEALFEVEKTDEIKAFFNSIDVEIEDEILITRTMNLDNKGEVKVNGHTITVSMLKELTASLVDIYGQQEQVGLLKQKYQLKLLDDFCGEDLHNYLCKYQEILQSVKKINEELSKYNGESGDIEREKDYLTFVIKEIENAKITVDEENELIEKKHKLDNIEKIVTNTSMCENELNASIPNISQAISSLNNVVCYDNNLQGLKERLTSAKIEIDDILETISSYNQFSNFDENEFDSIDKRIDLYKALKRKYGSTISEVLKYLEDTKQKLNRLCSSEEYVQKLTNEKQEHLKVIFDLSFKIDSARKSAAQKLSKNLVEILNQLGMPSAKLEFNFEDNEILEENFKTYGLNQVEIEFSANLGQEVRPLSKIASGGELSRLMLAIKAVVAKTDKMPTMIFDEIDTGISGKMAQAVSEKIASISINHQVIVITHLAQIASIADYNYLIEKKEFNGKTVSFVKLLNIEEKEQEIARFISIDGTMELGKASARALIEAQREYKKSLKNI